MGRLKSPASWRRAGLRSFFQGVLDIDGVAQSLWFYAFPETQDLGSRHVDRIADGAAHGPSLQLRFGQLPGQAAAKGCGERADQLRPALFRYDLGAQEQVRPPGELSDPAIVLDDRVGDLP
ncbi:hypothetical protein D3C87_1880510 [compost metagenome]